MTLSTWPRRTRGWARRLTACTKSDWRLVAQMTALRVSLPLLTRMFNVATLAEWLWASPSARLAATQRHDRVELIKSFVRKGGRQLVSGNCLDRSLMLLAVLSRADANPILVLGARKGETSLAGHAWVELDGEPIFDAEAKSYIPVVAFGCAASSSASIHVRSLV